MMNSVAHPGSFEQLELFVLDVLRHDDMEQITSIVRLLNDSTCIGWRQFWPRDFQMNEVVDALVTLEHAGHVIAFQESPSQELIRVRLGAVGEPRVAELWFGLTDVGRRRWNDWEPPA